MERWVGRVALVTGASVGIGAATCRKLVENGLIVVGCARNVERIQEMADSLKSCKGTLHSRRCDLACQDDIHSMFEWIENALGGVDICINNAGLGDYRGLLSPDATVESWRGMVDLNIIALCLCTKLAVNSMRARGVDDGQIIHINSMLGHRVPLTPTNHFYSATKHAVRALTEGHRQELRELKCNIRVAEISPGMVETQFAFNATQGNAEKAKEIYSSIKALQAGDVADAVMYVISAPPNVQVATANRQIDELAAVQRFCIGLKVHDILMRSVEQKA